ncbi:MAG TPA: CPBP family intramembrane glutamic endopeptidase [Acidobacteriota bacterium]|nr:CPBP family intramembrane glutamic endopeptidase [Acidobacteriota bacterium]
MAGNQPDKVETPAVSSEAGEAAGTEKGKDFEKVSQALVALAESSAQPLPPDAALPDRYVVRRSEEEASLSCLEAPNIVVHVERGMCVSSATARKSPPGTIYLDGAAKDAPFLDTERQVYNLDHHEGVVRSFTLSTCEQAYILLRKGLNLRDREWNIYANEPDIDTILAVWVLLNHRRLVDEDAVDVRAKILPLLRLEGIIDVHGLEMQELVCFSEDLHEQVSAWLGELIKDETEYKRAGRWSEISFPEYTAEMLSRIDALVYQPWHFDGFEVIDEIARVEITESQIAVICRSDAGIYDVEKQLSALHEKRLGLIVLQKDERTYTLRLVDLFMPVNLRRVYAQLNLIDPAAGHGEANRWGGSADIGGSPRATGTDLSPAEIAEGILRAFHKPTWGQVFSTAFISVVTPVIALLTAWAAGEFTGQGPETFTVGFLLSGMLLLLLFAKQYPRIYGFQMPLGRDWLLLAPAALAGGLLGGVWVPQGVVGEAALPEAWPLRLLLALGLPLAAEFVFRGLVHGLWFEEVQGQRWGGRWFLSISVVASTILYLAATFLPFLPVEDAQGHFWPQGYLPAGWVSTVLLGLGAVIFGIASGMARERSESIVPPILFHWLLVGLYFLYWSFLG